MSVMDPDNRYLQLKKQWKKNRDAYRGQRVIHAEGITYLPPVGDMDLRTKEGRALYDSFKERTLFFNATGSTVDGLTGLIFRKDPLNELPDQISYLSNSVNLTDTTLKEFEETVVRELMLTDIVGVHTTMPEVPFGISVKDAERMNMRPYLAMYKAEDILKVFYKNINNVLALEMIVLREFIDVEMGDEFNREQFEQYRVLDMYNQKDEEGKPTGNYIYRERLFDDSGLLVSEVFPLINGRNFTKIPFEILSVNSMGKATVEDLVNANINHYQYNASYSWGVYQLGFPTPFAKGIDEGEIPDKVGPGAFWTSESPDAEFGVVSGAPEGSRAGKEYLEKVEGYMAALGAEMLSPAKLSAETAESKRLDKQAQYSTLSTISQVVSAGIERALKVAAIWAGANPDEVKIQLNRDFYPTVMNAQMLQALMAALQSNSISYSTFWENLQKGEIASPKRTAEDEQEIIDSNVSDGINLE